MMRVLLVALAGLIALQGCGRSVAPKTVPGTMFSNLGASSNSKTLLEAELEAQIQEEDKMAGVEDDEITDQVFE